MNELWAIPAFYNLQTNQVIHEQGFNDVFNAARQQVQNMHMKIIDIISQHEQAMFEVYAHVALDTPYNSFRTH